MAATMTASNLSHVSNDSQRRRMAIDSVLNPNDENVQTTSYRKRSISEASGSRGDSSSPDLRGDYHRDQMRRVQMRRPSPGSGQASRERREFRPTYQQEEEYFIWYHRVDLGMDWSEVRRAYNAQFPQRQRRGFQGIQCKYYRCCETHGIPRVRERNRAASPDKSYGIRSRLPGVWYPWMRAQQPGASDKSIKMDLEK